MRALLLRQQVRGAVETLWARCPKGGTSDKEQMQSSGLETAMQGDRGSPACRRVPLTSRPMPLTRVTMDVRAELAVAFASLAVSKALAELLVEVLLRNGANGVVRCLGDCSGDLSLRGFPRRLIAPPSQRRLCSPPALCLLVLHRQVSESLGDVRRRSVSLKDA